MGRLLRWTILQITIFLTLKVRYSSCQNNQQGVTALPTGPVHQEYAKEYSNSNNPSPTPQLMNTLLTLAAANGVLPELLPKIQPLQIVETPYTAQVDHRNIATAPMQQPVLRHEQIFPHAQPIVSTDPYAHAVIPNHAAGYEAMAARPVPIVPPIVISPGLSTQSINPFITQNQVPHPPVVQPKEELCFCSDHTAASGHTPSSPPTLPMININTFDTSRLNIDPMCANSILTTENGVQYPVNLQISIPPPNVEPPRITFINAALPTSSGSYTSTDVNTASYDNWFPYGYAPQPQPVIVKKRKSPLKDWLPLIIYSMLHKDRGGCRNGGCCCCPCKSKRGGTVPIPYPIPIPTNSPIINTGYSNVSNYSQKTSNHNSTKNDNHHYNHRHHND